MYNMYVGFISFKQSTNKTCSVNSCTSTALESRLLKVFLNLNSFSVYLFYWSLKILASFHFGKWNFVVKSRSVQMGHSKS